MSRYQVATNAANTKYVPIPSSSCTESSASDGAVAQDERHSDGKTSACWDIVGKVIPIGPNYASLMATMEIFNFNINANGDNPTVPTNLALEKMGSIG